VSPSKQHRPMDSGVSTARRGRKLKRCQEHAGPFPEGCWRGEGGIGVAGIASPQNNGETSYFPIGLGRYISLTIHGGA
jgi:hypothetical protein